MAGREAEREREMEGVDPQMDVLHGSSLLLFCISVFLPNRLHVPRLALHTPLYVEKDEL